MHIAKFCGYCREGRRCPHVEAREWRERAHGFVELSREEGVALLDWKCRRDLDISGEEFLRRYDAGEYDHCDPHASGPIMLIPFARDTT